MAGCRRASAASSLLQSGPYRDNSEEGLPTFEYHWTVADHIQAVVDAGCRIVKVEEHGEQIEDEYWMVVDLNKLPAYLLIVGRKDLARTIQVRLSETPL